MGSSTTQHGQGIHSIILEWCHDLPGWQQDALRRIVENGSVTATDIDELTALCRQVNGLPEEDLPELQPLATAHIPNGVTTGQRVTLRSISQVENANALDSTQELSFGPEGLTVAFGYNGSGKSGYGRILRRACRARTVGEPILPNVMGSASGLPASAEITYALDGNDQPPEQWIDGQRAVDALGSVSFFDADCAAVHVQGSNNIAFTPLGLDVLPKLGDVCQQVKGRLDAEKSNLTSNLPQFLGSTHATGSTSVGKLLKTLKHDTEIEDVEALASLADAEMQRLRELPAQLANDPRKLAQELRTRSGRIAALQKTLATAAAALSDVAIESLTTLATDCQLKTNAAGVAAKVSFTNEPLGQIGEPVWRQLWEAARRFSTVAYGERPFPVTDTDDAVCVLCQRTLDDESRSRLDRFEAFVADDTAQQAAAAKDTFRLAVQKLDEVGLQDTVVREGLKDLQIASEVSLKTVRSAVAALLLRLRAIRNAWNSGDWQLKELPPLGDANSVLQTVVDALNQQAADHEESLDPVARGKLADELAELKAREWLATVVGDVKQHIDRLNYLQQVDACLKQTQTNSITAKSKELAKAFVTDQLRDAFATEIKTMEQGVRRLNVELAAAAGKRGSSYYRIQLVGARDADIGTVVSEGEHQCIALAGFLGELATESGESAIVFDDPVTSLDHQWRECFAKRLVEAAATRQVVVFTHDIVFLHDLMTGAERSDVPITLRRIQANRTHCGFVDDGLPWVAQKALQSLDELEKDTRVARSDYEQLNNDEYDRKIGAVYSRLRNTVERGVEEYVFKGVILRHRDYVNLTNLKMVTAVSTAHVERLQNLFQRCCDITDAHSRAQLRGFGVPTPDDALKDCAELRAIIDDLKAAQKLLA